MKTIAIIPAKGQSLRCPDKNIRQFAGRPLFLHSVQYARNEGIEPIVSTDSEAIMALCREHGVRVVRETVDDSTMANCVRQVLKQVPCDVFAVLLPTSPLRQTGLLRRMLVACTEEECESAFSAQNIKPIGQLDGKFRLAYRDQDTPSRFYFFDGNISVTKRSFFECKGELFDDDSRPFTHEFPCSLQIDTEEEFSALEHLARHAAFLHLLPRRVRRVCIISNRPWFTRDYSDFVDSCDVVIRISKMDNLDTQLTGSRTDIAVVSCWQTYLSFSREQRHTDVLRQVPHVFFLQDSIRLTEQHCLSERMENWSFLPPEVHAHTYRFTTTGKAIALADWLYPDAQLYFLGDTSSAIRTGGMTWHTDSGDDRYLAMLIQSGKLIHMMEEERSELECQFSHPLSSEKQSIVEKLMLWFAPDDVQHTELMLKHNEWSDPLRLTNDSACRTHCHDTASVLAYDGFSLTLKWDRWGIETFNLNAEGVYELAPTA